MKSKEHYEAARRHNEAKRAAAKAERAAVEAEQQAAIDSKKWWFKQRNPIDRFTGWLVVWTAFLFIATVASAIISALTLIEVSQGGKDTHALAEAAKAQAESLANQVANTAAQIAIMEADQRPWIKITSAEALTDYTGGSYLYAIVKGENIGKTPARNLRVAIGIFAHNATGLILRANQSKICDGNPSNFRTATPFVFPGGVFADGAIRHFADEADSYPPTHMIREQNTSFWLLGCVFYSGVDASKSFTTGFAFQIGKILSREVGDYQSNWSFKERIKRDEFVFIRDSIGDARTN